jgi:hypothetical protein
LKEQQDSGSGPNSAGDYDKGGSTNLKALDLCLPKEFYSSFTLIQKAWFNNWHYVLKKGTDPKHLAGMPKPSDEDVARYQKKEHNSVRFKEERHD